MVERNFRVNLFRSNVKVFEGCVDLTRRQAEVEAARVNKELGVKKDAQGFHLPKDSESLYAMYGDIN